jgi:hypothetical protein
MKSKIEELNTLRPNYQINEILDDDVLKYGWDCFSRNFKAISTKPNGPVKRI